MFIVVAGVAASLSISIRRSRMVLAVELTAFKEEVCKLKLDQHGMVML